MLYCCIFIVGFTIFAFPKYAYTEPVKETALANWANMQGKKQQTFLKIEPLTVG